MDITPASPAYRAITVANCSARIVAFRGSPCISIFIPRKTVPDEPKTAAPTQKPEVGCKAYPCTAAASPIKNLSTFTLYMISLDCVVCVEGCNACGRLTCARHGRTYFGILDFDSLGALGGQNFTSQIVPLGFRRWTLLTRLCDQKHGSRAPWGPSENK